MTINKNTAIAILVAVPLLFICCCCALFFLIPQDMFPSGPDGYRLPEPGASPSLQPSEEGAPVTGSQDDDVPVGGLGDGVLRADVWDALRAVSCDAGADDVSILTVDEMMEEWYIWCNDGGTEVYVVAYQESAGGGVDFMIGKVEDE